jgi:diguanylate cyclase (GGDEF)-like protein
MHLVVMCVAPLLLFRPKIMNNKNQPLRFSSGMFASLSGTHRALKTAGYGQGRSLDSENSALKANNILNFWDIRNCIQMYCNDGYTFQSPMSLFMLAIDDLPELKLRYGEDAANHAHMFMLKQLSQQRDFLFGVRSNILIGEYLPGRYLVLLPGIAGTDGAVIAEYFRKAIAEDSFVSNSRILSLTVSVGVVHKPGHVGTQDFMILQADQACEEAQFAGGNKVFSARLTEGFLKAS